MNCRGERTAASIVAADAGPAGLGFAAVGCAVIWLGGAISVTAWGQWLICARLLLPLSGDLPWRTRAFLRDAHERGCYASPAPSTSSATTSSRNCTHPPRMPRRRSSTLTFSRSAGRGVPGPGWPCCPALCRARASGA